MPLKNERKWRFFLAYDGKPYSGWQFQKHINTVQEEVCAAWTRIYSGINCPITATSRTDTGVHARKLLAQVRVPIDKGPPDESLEKSVNALLPKSIRLYGLQEILDDSFHVRGAIWRKIYCYHFFHGALPTPWIEPFVWDYRRGLDILEMQKFLDYLVGEHDFSAFRAAACGAAHPVCVIDRIELIEIQPHWHVMMVSGNRFLHHMIRNIAGAAHVVGLGKKSAFDMWQQSQPLNRQLLPPTAPAKGLWLWDSLLREDGEDLSRVDALFNRQQVADLSLYGGI